MKFDLSEITAIIRERRTIYPEQFSGREVQRDMVENILTNATWAPTHGKTQPWRFKVYSGEGKDALKKTMTDLYKTHVNSELENDPKYKRIISRIDATSVIIGLVMSRSPEGKIPKYEEEWAVAAATQNILLTATAYGLGSFWSSPGFLMKPGTTEKFGYTDQDTVMGLIYLGYPNEEWPRGHRKPLEYVTEWVTNG